MIPFLPSQNPGVLAALAAARGMPASARTGGDGNGAMLGAGFAPVFGGAVAEQIVSALAVDKGASGPASAAFAAANGTVTGAAWSKLSEVIRLASMATNAAPATLAQLRNALLSSVAELQQAIAQQVQATDATAPAVTGLPVTGSADGGAVILSAAVPAPSGNDVPATGPVAGDSPAASGQADETPPVPSRRRNGAIAQDASAALPAAQPVPFMTGRTAEASVGEALTALERIVARTPLSELPSLARALRQVITGKAAAAPVPGSVPRNGNGNGGRMVAVTLPSTEPAVLPATPISGGERAAEPVVPSTAPAANIAEPVTAPAVPGEDMAGLAAVPPVAPAAISRTGTAVEQTTFDFTSRVPAGNGDPGNVPASAAFMPEPDGEPPLSFISLDAVMEETLAPYRNAASPAGLSDNAQVSALVTGQAGEDSEPVAWLARQAEAGRAASPGQAPITRTNPAPEAVSTAPAREPAPVVPPVAASPVSTGEIPAISITALDLAADQAVPDSVPAQAGQDSSRPAGRVAEPAPVAPYQSEALGTGQASPSLMGVPAPMAGPDSPQTGVSAGASSAPAETASPVSVMNAVLAGIAAASRGTLNALPTVPEIQLVPLAPEYAVPAPAGNQPVPEEPAAANPAPATPETGPVVAATGFVETGAAEQGAAAVSMPEEAGDEAAPAVSPVVSRDEEAAPERGATPAASSAKSAGEATGAPHAMAAAPDGNQVTLGEIAGAGDDTPKRIQDEPASLPATAREAVASVRSSSQETASLPTAVQAVLSRVVEEVAAARPGKVRELDLRINSAELGVVHLKFEAGEEGTVRVVIRAQNAEAAQSLRDGLPAFRQIVETRNLSVSVEVAQAAIGTAADFGSGHAPHPNPDWVAPFQPSAPSVSRDDPEFASRPREGWPRRRTLVDILA